jgi:BolA protein
VDTFGQKQAIEDALRDTLEAHHVEVVDHSALHEGHDGAQGGGGHFSVLVVSEKFRGLTRVAAQRLVYEALGDLAANEIHALSMRTLTPEQWSR